MAIRQDFKRPKNSGQTVWASAFVSSKNSRLVHFIRLKKSAAATLLAIIAAIAGTWGWQAVAGSDNQPSQNQPTVQSSSSSTSSSSGSSGTSLNAVNDGNGSASATVDGQTYNQTGPGSIHKVINSNGSQTTIDIKVNNNGSNNVSSDNTQVFSSSSSDSQSSSSSTSHQMGGQ